MSKTLIFIEAKDDIIFLEKYFQKDCIVISMHPSVEIELSKKNIPYINTLNLFGKKGHEETVSFSKNILEISQPLFTQLGFNTLSYSMEKTFEFYLRETIYYMSSSIFIVDQAVQKYKTKKIVSLSRKKLSKLNLLPISSDRVLGHLISQYCSSHELKCIHIKVYDTNSKLKKLVKKIKNTTRYLIFNMLLFLYSIIYKNKSALLAPDDSYNMSRLLGEVSPLIPNSIPVYLNVTSNNILKNILRLIQGKSFFFFFSPSPIFSRKRKEISERSRDFLFSSINSFEYKKNNFVIFGVDLQDFISNYINNQIINELLRSYGADKSIKRLLNIVKPKYVFSQHSLGDSHILGEHCLLNSIPGIMVPHGTHSIQHNKLAKFTWTTHAHTMINSPYPFVALQTPRDTEFLQTQKKVSSKTIKTGPLLFARTIKNNSYDNLRSKLFAGNSEKRIILHASSPKSFYSFHPLIYETFDEYIKNINDTIKAVKAIPNLYLAVRYRPSKDLSIDEFKKLLILDKCYEVYSQGAFEDYLLASDLLLSYSSTTIEEALNNNIPVLQYDPEGKYEHFPGQILSAHVKSNYLSTIYSVHNNDDLKPALNWWATKHLKSDNEKIFSDSKLYLRDNNLSWLDQLKK